MHPGSHLYVCLPCPLGTCCCRIGLDKWLSLSGSRQELSLLLREAVFIKFYLYQRNQLWVQIVDSATALALMINKQIDQWKWTFLLSFIRVFPSISFSPLWTHCQIHGQQSWQLIQGSLKRQMVRLNPTAYGILDSEGRKTTVYQFLVWIGSGECLEELRLEGGKKMFWKVKAGYLLYQSKDIKLS